MAKPDRSDRIFEFIKAYVDDHGFPPAIRDIQRACRLSSTSVVSYHLDKLAGRGLIRRSRDVARGIEIVGRRAAVQDLPFHGTLVGDRPPGGPTGETVAVAHPQRTEFPQESYCVRVAGPDFTNALIAEGDLLVLDPEPSPVDLQVVWAHETARVLIGYMDAEGVLRAGPLAEPALVSCERLAGVVASFRSY